MVFIIHSTWLHSSLIEHVYDVAKSEHSTVKAAISGTGWSRKLY
jgi:hypothetical protein